MPVRFPPQPVYPVGLDSDRTLFLVYNTSEAQLTSDNRAWSETVEIEPVADDAAEIWADNGFANISGELFYYDAVEKNDAGKVFKFKNCARNLAGKKTKFNAEGTWVRGFVIAEHHNQLVDAIIATELFVLDLEDRINRLVDEERCTDDNFCPEIDFKFEIDDDLSSGCNGTVVNYEIDIFGPFNDFQLDFGDGELTIADRIGTHTYPPNSTIDPVVRVSNDHCTIVQTPVERNEPQQPTPIEVTVDFQIPIPSPPDFPVINIPDIDIPIPQIELPQIVFPCVELGSFGVPSTTISIPSLIINVPSEISFGPVNIPSIISFARPPSFSPISFANTPSFPTMITFGPAPALGPITFGPAPALGPINFGPVTIPDTINFGPVTIPTTINFSPVTIPNTITFGPVNIPTTITFGPAPNFPSLIEFGPAPTFPSEITFGPAPTIPSQINIEITGGNIPSSISITGNITGCSIPETISFGPAPNLTVSFGELPTMSVNVNWGTPPTLSCDVTVSCGGASPLRAARVTADDLLDETFQDTMDSIIQIDSDSLGIPSQIEIVVPKFPDLKLRHNLPESIELKSSLPESIELVQKIPLPTEILLRSSVPDTIKLDSKDIPRSIPIDASGLPESIKLEIPEMPKIKVDASDIPDSIKVIGIPDTIVVKMPSEIVARLEMPENLEVPMVYKGGPIPFRFDSSGFLGEGDHPCFALIPCNPK